MHLTTPTRYAVERFMRIRRFMRVRRGWRSLVRLRFGGRSLVAAGLVAATVLTAIVSFGPIVRSVVIREATKRRLIVDVGSVAPGWWSVRLRDVWVHLQGAPGLSLYAAEVRISLTATLTPKQLDVYGGRMVATGTEVALRTQLSAWRDAAPEAPAPSSTSHRRVPVEVHDATVRWDDGVSSDPRLIAGDVALASEGDTFHASVGTARVRWGRAVVDARGGAVDVQRPLQIDRAHAAAVTVEWTRTDEPAADATARRERDPVAPPVLAANAPAPGKMRRRPVPDPPADPRAPILPLPDLHALRAQAQAASTLLATFFPVGADVGVDAVTWKVSRPADSVAFTLGPGDFSLRHDSGGFAVRFSADGHGTSTPLSLEATLPPDGGDIAVNLDGGPISLGLLGVRESALGLVDVDRASVSGRARVALAGDGGALTFDVEAGAKGLSIENPRLASDAVRGLDLGIVARGVVSAAGELRVDDLETTLGTARLNASGVLRQDVDHAEGAFRVEVPQTSCQALIDGIPAALLPTLHGAKTSGTFALAGHAAFDTRALDDLELAYDTRDECRLVAVPPALAREQFDQEFTYRVYLPDGSIGERATGPGSDNWTSLESISPYMQVAVLTTEDGAFLRHHGFNRAAIRSALIANLKARRFVRGASTITMQLAKNLFLVREKTLSRKLEEVILTDYLEQTFTKDELIELYLNVIEFGPSVYGIGAAADYYFGRTPAELDLAECLFLSSLLPAPLRYGLMRAGAEVPEGWMRTLHGLMEIAHRTHRISDVELAEGEAEPVVFWHGGDRPLARPPVQARPRFDGEIDDVTTSPSPADIDGP